MSIIKTGLHVHSMRYFIFVICIYFIDDQDGDDPVKDVDDREQDGEGLEGLDVDEDEVDFEGELQAEADEPPTAPEAPTDPKQGNFDVHISFFRILNFDMNVACSHNSLRNAQIFFLLIPNLLLHCACESHCKL